MQWQRSATVNLKCEQCNALFSRKLVTDGLHAMYAQLDKTYACFTWSQIMCSSVIYERHKAGTTY